MPAGKKAFQFICEVCFWLSEGMLQLEKLSRCVMVFIYFFLKEMLTAELPEMLSLHTDHFCSKAVSFEKLLLRTTVRQS